jgi:hypothetical protein
MNRRKELRNMNDNILINNCTIQIEFDNQKSLISFEELAETI